MKKIYSLRKKWKETMRVFLGLCPICGNESKSHYHCSECRRKQRARLKKRICKIPFCQNITPKGTQFCNEHGYCRSYYQKGYKNACKVNFNICKYCGKLFTSKQSNSVTCKACVDNHMQAKQWKIENKEKVKEFGRKHYHKMKNNVDFKARQKASRIKNKPSSDKYFKEYAKTEKRAAAIKENNRKRSLTPELKERAMVNSMYIRLFLSDGYIMERILRHNKIKKENITPEMIILKRDLLKNERITKELNNVINRR